MESSFLPLRNCIKCDRLGGKILTIHSRNAEEEVINIIGSRFNGKIILHWYTGNKANLKKAIENGYYFSVNLEMLKTSKGKELIKYTPLERLLVESDGPFSRVLNNTYTPNFSEDIITTIGEIKGLEVYETYSALKENFRTVLS